MAVIYYGTGLLFMIIGNYLPKVKQGAKGRKIVVGNAEKKLFSAFFEHYYNVKESSASTHICKFPSRYSLAYSGGSLMDAVSMRIYNRLLHCNVIIELKNDRQRSGF